MPRLRYYVLARTSRSADGLSQKDLLQQDGTTWLPEGTGDPLVFDDAAQVDKVRRNFAGLFVWLLHQNVEFKVQKHVPHQSMKFFPPVVIDGETVKPRRYGDDSLMTGWERWDLRSASGIQVICHLGLPNGTSDEVGLRRLGVIL